MKDLMSGIDFISGVSSPDALLLGDVEHMPSGPSGPGRERQLVNYDGSGVFTSSGITWGVEVCLDHAEGRLQRSPQLPGENQIQVQLIPSCGMCIQLDQVTAEQGGYVFNCDGLGNGASVAQVSSAGSPPVTALIPIAATGAYAVDASPLDTNQSPPQSVAINQLYQAGAGAVSIYAPVVVPPANTVAGTVKTLTWPATPDYQFGFDLVYDANGAYTTTLCQITSSKTNFNGLKYFLPLALSTTDSSGGTVSIKMKSSPGSYGYDQAVWCKISVPNFTFEGNAFEFYDDLNAGDPDTCWD